MLGGNERFSGNALWGTILLVFAADAEMAAISRRSRSGFRQDPSRKLSMASRFGINPASQAAMRAAMGERFFALSQKATHIPDAPVASTARAFSPYVVHRRMILRRQQI